MLHQFKQIGGDRFVSFEKECLKGVIFGDNTSEEDRDTIIHLIRGNSDYKHVVWEQARKDAVNKGMKIEPLIITDPKDIRVSVKIVTKQD